MMNGMGGMMMWAMGLTAILVVIVLTIFAAALFRYLLGTKSN
jgi:hypothetical protein